MLILSGYHELVEAQMLPSSAKVMRWVGPLVRNEVYFLVLLLALPLYAV